MVKKNGTNMGEMFIEGRVEQAGHVKDSLSSILSRRFDGGSSHTFMRSSRINSSLNSSVSGKKYSAMMSNNEIKIPKERRFFDMLTDPKSSVVSYE